MCKCKWSYIFGLTLSIVASAVSAVPSIACVSCGRAQLYIDGVPLAWIGLCLYVGLLIGGLNYFASLRILFFIAILAGAHIAIQTSFPDHSCLYCRFAFTGSLLALFALIIKQGSLQLMPLLALAASMICFSIIIHTTHLLVMESPDVRKLVIALNTDSTFDSHYINVVVFESPTCHLCREFNTEYEPQLLHDSHRPLRFFHKASEAITAFPTIIIVGRQNDIYMGLPPYDSLLKDIKQF